MLEPQPLAEKVLQKVTPRENPLQTPTKRGPKLKGPTLDYVLTSLAEYRSYVEIINGLKELYGLTITPASISHRAHNEKWREEIQRRRAALDHRILDVPISSRWWRQTQRNGLYDKAKDNDRLTDTARKTLMDAAEEMGHLRRGETQSQPSIVVNVLAALQGSSPEALRAYAETGALPQIQASQLAPGIDGHPVGCRCAECPYAKAASNDAMAASTPGPVIDTTAAHVPALSTESIAVSALSIAAAAPATDPPTVIPAAGERRAWPQAPPDMQAPGQTNPHVETLLKTRGNPASDAKAILPDVSSAEVVAESTACAKDAPQTTPAIVHGPACHCEVCVLWQDGIVKRRRGRPRRRAR